MKKFCRILAGVFLLVPLSPGLSRAWHDKTHIAVTKVAGYYKWFNACGADMAKLKAGSLEAHNHHVNNPPGAVVKPEAVINHSAGIPKVTNLHQKSLIKNDSRIHPLNLVVNVSKIR